MTLASSFTYTFPAIRGIQAGREYYVAIVPLSLIPKIFLFDEEEIPAKVRAQRTLNKARIPEIAQYILEHPKDYVFSAVTASIDGELEFVPIDDERRDQFPDVGKLLVRMDARFLINDGQHRRAAIEVALKENPPLGQETISVVFFKDEGLQRSQQMFADLNRYARKPTKSLAVLYDYRDDLAEVARQVAEQVPAFVGMIEMERVSLAARNPKLFTLSSLYEANRHLLGEKDPLEPSDTSLAAEFWKTVAAQFPDWELAKERKLLVRELRKDTVHAHGVVLQALGMVGRILVAERPKDWRPILANLSKIDWSRDNKQWEGICLLGGRMAGTSGNVRFTAIFLRKLLGLPITDQEATDLKTAKQEAVAKIRA